MEELKYFLFLLQNAARKWKEKSLSTSIPIQEL